MLRTADHAEVRSNSAHYQSGRRRHSLLEAMLVTLVEMISTTSNLLAPMNRRVGPSGSILRIASLRASRSFASAFARLRPPTEMVANNFAWNIYSAIPFPLLQPRARHVAVFLEENHARPNSLHSPWRTNRCSASSMDCGPARGRQDNIGTVSFLEAPAEETRVVSASDHDRGFAQGSDL